MPQLADGVTASEGLASQPAVVVSRQFVAAIFVLSSWLHQRFNAGESAVFAMRKLILIILCLAGFCFAPPTYGGDTNRVATDQVHSPLTGTNTAQKYSDAKLRSVRVEPKRYSLIDWQEDVFKEMGIGLDRPTSAFIYARFKDWILIELHPVEPPAGVYDDAVWFFDVNIRRSSLDGFQAAGGKLRPETEMAIEKAHLSAGMWDAHVFRRTLRCSNGDVVSVEARVFPYATLSGKSFLKEDSAAAQRIVDSVHLAK
jgi:hypothetical protein